MAKWRRGGGGRRGRWVIEYVPRVDTVDGVDGAAGEPDPFTFDTPEEIRAALWRFEQRKMIEEKRLPELE